MKSKLVWNFDEGKKFFGQGLEEPCREKNLEKSELEPTVGGDLAKSIKRSASDCLGDLVP